MNVHDIDWVAKHREAWDRKPGLRDYYETQIFDRIVDELTDGPTLQLGSGPGFFTQYRRGMVNSDITAHAGVDAVADVHALPFAEASFDNIVGVDVLHHFASPGDALGECARALRPGGRIVLVEPWAGPLGWPFYKYVHHEDCADVPDPWTRAFPDAKDPMDGNGAIPLILLHRRATELQDRVPGLHVAKAQPFGGVSYLLTGGFQQAGLPASITRCAYRLENVLPRALMSFFALRALFVIDKSAAR